MRGRIPAPSSGRDAASFSPEYAQPPAPARVETQGGRGWWWEVCLAGAVLTLTAPLATAQHDLGSSDQAGSASETADEPYTPPVEPASGEGEAAMSRFELATGIVTDLFAAEPMLANPVCLYVDFAGDVYVNETFRHYAGVTDIREHLDWLDEDIAARTVADRIAMMASHEGDAFDAGYNVEHERVRLIRDTDGDGVADVATVFADGFKDHAAGIAAGVLSYRGDVYYTCIPDLWRLADTDSDGVADEREVLHTGFGVRVALLGHDLHGLRIGPDRRLYFSIGDRAFHVETADGVLAHPDSGAVLRCDLDGANLEIVHDGMRNPQELVFDDHGNLWTGENNSDGGDKARWVHVVEGGDSGWRYPYQWIETGILRGPWNDEKLWYPPFEGQAAYVLPPIANLGHGPSGLTYYPGTGLGSAYAGHFFLCDFRGDANFSGIHTFTVQPRGAFWELGPAERFVWNTLVTDCDFGPDGRLYFSDWVHGWNRTGKGRVYRAFDPEHVDSDLVRETQELLAADLSKRHSVELVALLAHADQRVRQEAHFALADRDLEGVEHLAAIAASAEPLAQEMLRFITENPASAAPEQRLPRLHAIWGLAIASRRWPQAALEALVPLTLDDDPEVRAQAVRVLGDEKLAPATDAVTARLRDEDARVRFFAALAAGRLEAFGVARELTELLADAGQEDPNLRHAAVMGLLGTTNPETIVRLAADPNPDVRMGALLVQRRRGEAEIERFLADADPRLVLEAARAIHDLPIEAALPRLAALELPPDAPRAMRRRVLNASFHLGDAERLGALALQADLDVEARVEALEMLASWSNPPRRDRVLNSWRPIPARPLADVEPVIDALVRGGVTRRDDALVPPFCELVVNAEAVAHTPELLAVFESDRGTAARVAAFEALGAFVVDDWPDLVRAALGDVDGEVRAVGLSALERVAPDEALPSLPSILALGETPERRAALRILGRLADPRAAELLAVEIERVGAGLFPEELALDLALAVETRGEAALVEALATRRSGRALDPELAPWLDSLHGGDAERGSAVFRKSDLSCVRCHSVEEGAAQQIGPDLTGVTQRLSRMQVLESIVAPNRRTTPGYAGTVLFLYGGDVVNGRVVEETETALQILDADGNVTEIFLEDVEERRPDLSAMPEDLGQSLSREEMRDLVAYLATLRSE